MQLSITTSLQQTQLDYSQLSFSQSSYGMPQQQLQPPLDQIELSDEARHRHKDGQHVNRVHHGQQKNNDNPVFGLLKNIIEQITGARIDNLQKQPQDGKTSAPLSGDSSSFSGQQASLTIESKSLSIAGSLTTSDGATVSFALDLQIEHANASAVALNSSSGPAGYNFNFAGSSLDLTSTSFSFSLTAEQPDGTANTGNGFGVFSLKDDLKEIRQAMKPLLKEFMKESGMQSEGLNANQLLRAIV